MHLDDDAYRRLFDANPRPTWVFDRETRRILAANETAVRVYGWSRDELLAMTLDDLRPPDERARFLAGYMATRTAPTYSRTARHWKKSGAVMDVQLEITTFTLGGREVCMSSVVDMTGIAEAERRFRLLVENSAEAIAVTNEHGIVEYVSPAAERILGYPASEVIGKTPEPRVHPDDVPTWTPPPPGETKLHVSRVRHRDGSYRWIESTTTNLRHDPGVRAFVSNYRDVTERRLAEESLRRSEANFRALSERSPSAILVHRDGVHVYVNPAMSAMLGYHSPADLIGKPSLDFVHPDDRDRIRERMRRVLDVGETPAGEVRMLKQDGSVVVLEAEGMTLNFDGKPSTVVIGRDVTERRELFARMALADRMLTVGTLAAGVAHEINNPLAYAATNLEVLASELACLLANVPTRLPPGELPDLVADAREGVARVSAIVRDLRSLARPDDDTRGPVDVRAVLASSLKMAFNEIRHRARVIETYAPGLTRVHAHPSRLGQVFLNLLLNAAQAIPEGRADQNEIRVRATAAADGRHVDVEIEDTGIGIPASLQRRIFDPFFTTKAPGVGMGLGLAISHQIVRAMDGQIAVESQPGVGTTFRVTLPVAAAATDLATSVATRAPASTARILLVDDEPALGRSLCALLDDHEVVPVTSGRDALARLAGERFDVILCDLMMPDLSGIELYEQMPATHRERVVFMTGGAFTPQAREFLARSARPRLDKPFSEHELRDAIERVRSTRDTRRDPPAAPA